MTRASATRRTLLLCLVTTVVACRTSQVKSERKLPCDQEQWRRVSAERSRDSQWELERQVASIEPKKDSLATGTAIIDIHTHTFNARYLPLRNILLGKRDAKPPLTCTDFSPGCRRNRQSHTGENINSKALGFQV